MASLTVRGLTELKAALAKLGIESRTQVLSEGIQAAAGVLRAEQARLAPRRTGRLSRDIQAVFSIASGVAVARVGPSRDTFYGQILNQGAKPHTIKPKRASRRRVKKKALATNGKIIGTVAHHPGIRPKPFITLSATQGAFRATDAAAKAMFFAIDRIAASVPKVS